MNKLHNPEITNSRKIKWLILIFLLILNPILMPFKIDAASFNNTTFDIELPQTIDIVDTLFRPDNNGFSFPNYGNEFGAVGLTPVEMQRMFGDKVIVHTADGNVILTYQAKKWMYLANRAMARGHCEGMAVLSNLFYYNKTNPTDFGGRTTIELPIIRNDLLQREIAYWWATQLTHPGNSKKVNESPNVVLDTLVNAFKESRSAKEWWILALFKQDRIRGHAITPFAVENMTNSTARILVYDNNFPKETKAVEINRAANTWKYNGSINPLEPLELYSGNESTHSLEISSISSRLGPQICDFCIDGATTKGSLPAQKYTQIWGGEINRILIAEEHGRRIGFTDSGNFLNEIPGAERLDLRFSGIGENDSRRFSVYNIPANLKNISIKFSISQEKDKCEEIFNNWNKNAVDISPSSGPSFKITKPYYICTIETYHWNKGQGTLSRGAISLRKDDNIIGIWATEAGPDQSGMPNAVWIAHPNRTIPPGNYTVVDTDIKTWSQNNESHHLGFSKVEGYPIDIELWILGPGYDIGMLNQGDQGFYELTWSGEDIAKLAFNNAITSNLIFGIGNREFTVLNAPRIGILELINKAGILNVTNNQPGMPIPLHLEMNTIDANGEHRIMDDVSIEKHETISFPDPCKGAKCSFNQHCENGKCVDNPDPCENVTCPEDYYCDNYNGMCFPIKEIKDPCAGVSCPACQHCENGACVGTCPDPCEGVICDPGKYCVEGKCYYKYV
jgi:hypothetical protein